MHRASSRSHRRKKLGVTLLEALITFPILLFLILMLIDFMRYVSVKQSLEATARQALTLATVIPGLEMPDSTSGTPGPFEQARDAVAHRALNLDSTIFFGPAPVGARFITPQPSTDIVWVPPISPGATNRDLAFSQEPIRITLRARMGFFSAPGLWEIPIEARAAGFREPRVLSSQPIPLDCNGRPFVPGQPLNCSCPAGQVLDLTTGQCRCPPCPSGQTLNPTNCSCSCPPPLVIQGGSCVCPASAQAACTAQGQVMDPATCSCRGCPPGTMLNPVTQQCACPQVVQTGGVCPGAGPLGPFLDLASCQCNCPPNTVLVGQQCSCPAPFVIQGSQCVCPQCPAGLVPTGVGCGCACPPGQQQNGPTCECITVSCPSPQVPAPFPACGCRCPTSCGPNQVQGADCSCSCAPGLVWNASQSACVCPDCPPGLIPGGALACGCVCPACPGGQVLQPGPGCSCGCPNGTSWNGTSCACNSCPDPIMLQQPQTCACSCPRSTTPIFDNGALVACDQND